MALKPYYPARPVNGGRLEQAPVLPTEYADEPKLDGWRVTIHVLSLLAGLPCCQNREGKMLSIEDKFVPALNKLRQLLAGSALAVQYIDAEGLQNRHRYAQGTLVILDYVPTLVNQLKRTYTERRADLVQLIGTVAPLAPGEWVANSLYLVPSFTGDPMALYQQLRQLNHGYQTGNTKGGDTAFYEGIVRKAVQSKYPFPKTPSTEFGQWIKHRFH